MGQLVLIAAAAQESEYTVAHISLLLRKGKIKGEKVGGTWMVDIQNLREYEAQMKILGTKKFDPTKQIE
jgi:hypothetical protein